MKSLILAAALDLGIALVPKNAVAQECLKVG